MMKSTVALALVACAGAASGTRADLSYAFVFGEPAEITKNGSAVFANGAYELTTADGQAGSMFHADKQQVRDGFHSIFSFRIGQASILGDGLAFVLHNDPAGVAALGNAGSGLGYEGLTSALAIEIDTFSFHNPEDPQSEPPAIHVALHTGGNDPVSSEGGSTVAFAILNLPLDRLGSDVNVAVTYVPPDPDEPGSEGNLQVWVEEQEMLNVDIDLGNITDVGLDGDSIVDENGFMFMGFTASTGLADSTHVITDWTVRDNTGRSCVEPQWHLASWGSGSDGTNFSAAFTVEVSGSRPIAFSWLKDDVELDPNADPTRIVGADSPRLTIAPATMAADSGFYRLRAVNACGTMDMDNFMRFGIENECNDIDFNNDGLFPDDNDLIAFLAVLAGGDCPGSVCDPLDFNNDSLFPDDSDLIAFLRVLAGGSCAE